MLKNWDREEVAALLRECGKTALDFFGKTTIELKSDRSVVTEADKTIEKNVTAVLANPEQGVYVIGEETVSSRTPEYFRNALNNTAWIVDPVDGTALFANNLPMWGTSIGFAQNGEIREGAIIVPLSNMLILSDRGKVYLDKGDGLKEIHRNVREFSDASMIAISQRIARCGLYHGKQNLHSIGSCVFPGLMTALGAYSAMVARAYIWDVAGYLPILKALGYVSMNRRGTDILSLKITPDNYNLDFESEKPFFIPVHNVVAQDAETCKKILDLIEFPEDMH